MLTPMSLKYTFSELLSLPEDVLVQHLVKVKDENGNIVLQTADNPELAPIADQDVVREKLLCATTSAFLLAFIDWLLTSCLFTKLQICLKESLRNLIRGPQLTF